MGFAFQIKREKLENGNWLRRPKGEAVVCGNVPDKDPNVQLNQERRALRRSFVLPVLHEANKTAR